MRFFIGGADVSELYKAVRDNDLPALKLALTGKWPADELAGALRNAAEKGQVKQIEALLNAGARDDWAIAAAASFAPVETVRFLYEKAGGNLNAALIGAAAHGRTETTRFLLTLPVASLNEALADAALRGYRDIVLMLLEKGADPLAEVYGGQTAVELAAKRGYPEITALLERKETCS